MSGLALQAASKTNDTAGDGTTTATILSAAIIAEGMKIVAAGTNPIQVRRAMPSRYLPESASRLRHAVCIAFGALILLLVACKAGRRRCRCGVVIRPLARQGPCAGSLRDAGADVSPVLLCS